MEISLVMKTARSATVEIADGGRYFTKAAYVIDINGKTYGVTDRTITSLFGLIPDSEQKVEVYTCTDQDTCAKGEKLGEVSFRTA